jgi:hypothetical protein
VARVARSQTVLPGAERARAGRRESTLGDPRERRGLAAREAPRALQDARSLRNWKVSQVDLRQLDLREREAHRRLRASTHLKGSRWGLANWRVLRALPGVQARKARKVRGGLRARKAGKARKDPEALRAPGAPRAKRAPKVGKGQRELRVLKVRELGGAIRT